MWIYYLLLLTLLGMFFWCSQLNGRLTSFITFSVVLLLIVFSAVRGDVDNDHNSYIESFNRVGSPLEYIHNFREYSSLYEPFYYLIPSFSKLLFPNWYHEVSFLVFSVLGVSFKVIGYNRLGKTFFLSTLIYFSYYFLLHEMTQIRVGVATGLLLISIQYILERSLSKFLFYISIAACFHYSSILFLPLYFLDWKNIRVKTWMVVLFLPYFLYLAHFDFLSMANIASFGVFSSKIAVYQQMFDLGQFDTAVNIFNIRALIQIAIILLLLSKIRYLQGINRYSILLVKILIISSGALVLFSPLPVLAFRVHELYGIVQIVAYPLLIYVFKERWIGLVVVLFIVGFMFYLNIVYLSLLKPYI